MLYIIYQPAPNAFGYTLLTNLDEYLSRTYIPVYGDDVAPLVGADPDAMLEEIFCIHNSDERPLGIRSLSVGDIVVLKDNGVWLCDRAGWTLLASSHIPPGVAV